MFNRCVLVAAVVVFASVVAWCAVRSTVPAPANGLLGPVPIPKDNPQTPAKIALGRQLYFDKRLSLDKSINCASCHEPNRYWADPGHAVSKGVAHKLGKRNSPTILNAAYSVPQFWDGRAIRLEKQAVGPVSNPLEMDLPMPRLLARLNAIAGYRKQFKAVFGGPATADNVAKAIASFERTIVNGNSPYDEYLRGNKKSLSASAIRGMKLFSGKAGCIKCHSGPYFSDSKYHNLGIGYANGKYSDVGRYDVTAKKSDMGRFKTPTLRNVAMTPPYMHDGSVGTLAQVINIYNRGGIPNPNLDRDIKPLGLSQKERADLEAFLKSLTGKPVIVKPPALPK